MKQVLSSPPSKKLLTLKEASLWAGNFLKREISESNISYLIQYGKIKKYSKAKSLCVCLEELKKYYESQSFLKEKSWKKQLGSDLNWALSFDHLREKDTTKHVHRLHPYKGKFIPQLVEYFIDNKTDAFKKEVYFKKEDVILDPFCGSGTTLVQANEMGMHSIGLDISRFNCLIGESKLLDYNIPSLKKEVQRIEQALDTYLKTHSLLDFEKDLSQSLTKFNNSYFPSPDFKYQLARKKIDELSYSKEKEKEFLRIYNQLVKKHGVLLSPLNSKSFENSNIGSFKNPSHFKSFKNSNTHSTWALNKNPPDINSSKSFLDKWYIPSIRQEIDFLFKEIQKTQGNSQGNNQGKDQRQTQANNKKLLSVILSRAIRSCRATTHFDLATLKQPQVTSYYCFKHKKICKPLFSMRSWFKRYAKDSLKRIEDFSKLKTSAFYAFLPADSRTVSLFDEIKKTQPDFYKLLKQKKIKGVFSSPPYVGQIDYHTQHAYSYDLFNFKRKDQLEIGPLYKGQGAKAKQSYIEGISQVLKNSKPFLSKDFDIFLVANDKHQLYLSIAQKAGLKIINQFKRPVLNRTERDKNPYSESIFHLKNNC